MDAGPCISQDSPEKQNQNDIDTDKEMEKEIWTYRDIDKKLAHMVTEAGKSQDSQWCSSIP